MAILHFQVVGSLLCTVIVFSTLRQFRAPKGVGWRSVEHGDQRAYDQSETANVPSMEHCRR